jgi:hypothetical protein
MHVCCTEKAKTKNLDHLACRLQLIKELFEARMKSLEPPCPGRLLKRPASDRLTARYFTERVSPSEKKAKLMKWCAVCFKTSGKRKELPFDVWNMK